MSIIGTLMDSFASLPTRKLITALQWGFEPAKIWKKGTWVLGDSENWINFVLDVEDRLDSLDITQFNGSNIGFLPIRVKSDITEKIITSLRWG